MKAAQASRWQRFCVWLFGAPKPKTPPFIGPGHCPDIAQHFGHGLVPPKPLPRDCTAMRPMAVRSDPPPIETADVPWPLFKVVAAAIPVETQSASIPPREATMDQTLSNVPTTETIAELMQRLVTALADDPIPATVVHLEAAAAPESGSSQLAHRLKSVAKLNRPKQGLRKTRVAYTRNGTMRPHLGVSAAAPRNEEPIDIDQLVARAASNVVSLIAKAA